MCVGGGSFGYAAPSTRCTPHTARLQVAFIGLGNMGKPMATNLLMAQNEGTVVDGARQGEEATR